MVATRKLLHSGTLIIGTNMKWNKYIPTKVNPRKVYDSSILRPKKPSLVKKGFNTIKNYLQSKIVW